jgi:hypothetical protein
MFSFDPEEAMKLFLDPAVAQEYCQEIHKTALLL